MAFDLNHMLGCHHETEGVAYLIDKKNKNKKKNTTSEIDKPKDVRLGIPTLHPPPPPFGATIGAKIRH